MKTKRFYFFLIAVILISACGGLNEKQKKSAEDAINALQKIKAATEVGINNNEYSRLLIDVKTSVSGVSKDLPDGNLKTEILSAADAYEDVGLLWSIHNQLSMSKTGILFMDILEVQKSKDGKLIKDKYEVKSSNKESVFAEIWEKAEKKVDSASSLLR